MNSLIKAVIIGIGIPVVVLIFWMQISGPIDELRLITQGAEAKGYVIKAEQMDEEVADTGEKIGVINSCYYEYRFVLPNGRELENGDILNAEMPNYLINVAHSPYPVTIQYLDKKPEINRVKEFSNNKTVGHWFRKTFMLGFLFFLIAASIGFMVIKDSYKKYLLEEKLFQDSKNVI